MIRRHHDVTVPVLAILGTLLAASTTWGQGEEKKDAPKRKETEARTIRVTIYGIDAKSVTFSESGRGRGRGRGRRGGGPGGAGGGRRGRGRGMRAAQQTLPLVADPKITRAQVERRTGIFRVGIDLAGGWRNRAFADVRSGVPGRVTIVDGRVKEINVVTERRSVIAVPPKRPPKPGGTPR